MTTVRSSDSSAPTEAFSQARIKPLCKRRSRDLVTNWLSITANISNYLPTITRRLSCYRTTPSHCACSHGDNLYRLLRRSFRVTVLCSNIVVVFSPGHFYDIAHLCCRHLQSLHIRRRCLVICEQARTVNISRERL